MSWGLSVLSVALSAFVVLFADVAISVHDHRPAKQPGYGDRRG